MTGGPGSFIIGLLIYTLFPTYTKERALEKYKLRKLRNRAVASVTAAAAALGLLFTSAFDNPAQLLEKKTADLPPAPITELAAPDLDDGGGDDDVDEALPGEEKKKSLRARLRQSLLALPWSVRAITALPLWLLGWGLTTTASALWSGLLSPVGGAVLGCAGTAAAAAAAAAVTAKAVFPDMPIKRVFSKKGILTLVIGSLLYGIITAMVELFIPEAEALRRLIEGVSLLVLLLSVVLPTLKRENARRLAAGAETAVKEEPQESVDDFRRRTRQLADSAK